jgi:hypothetical protein
MQVRRYAFTREQVHDAYAAIALSQETWWRRRTSTNGASEGEVALIDCAPATNDARVEPAGVLPDDRPDALHTFAFVPT